MRDVSCWIKNYVLMNFNKYQKHNSGWLAPLHAKDAGVLQADCGNVKPVSCAAVFMRQNHHVINQALKYDIMNV